MKIGPPFFTRLVLVCLSVLLLWPDRAMADLPGGEDRMDLAEVLEQIRQRYDVTDFEADFHQESVLEAMGIVDTATGHVAFRPPTDMRWHYETPEEYILVLNEEKIWLYWPEDRQVMVGEPKDYLGHTGFGEFFSEPTRLLKNFHIEMPHGKREDSDSYTLKLTPRQPDPNLEKAFLRVSRQTFLIVETIVYNTFGDKTTIRFSDVRFNQGLDPALFVLEVPEGAQVLPLEPQ